MRKRSTLAFAGCLLMAAMASTGTAQAAVDTGQADCITTGAAGNMGYSQRDYRYDGVYDISLGVTDMNADGNHVAVRLITTDSGGVRTNWAWHHWYDGAHTGYTWYTTAQSNNGIAGLAVQVGRFEGDKLLNSCTDWARK